MYGSQKCRVMSSRIICASDLNRVKEIKRMNKKSFMKYKVSNRLIEC